MILSMSVCRSISSGIETTGATGAGAPVKFLQLNKGVLSHSLHKPHHMHMHILNERHRHEFQRELETQWEGARMMVQRWIDYIFWPANLI